MDDDSKKKYELKKQLKHLKSLRGSGTELISVYIPANAAIHETTNKLSQEAGQATNIKSKSTRKSVGDALAKILHHLKSYGHNAPKSGLAIFCGNVSDNQSKTDVQLFTIFPPEPINVQVYRCDSTFFLEPLERIVEVKDTYGLVVMDGRECTIARLRGTNIDVLRRLNSTAHAKIRAGGQSARRYERLIEESIEKYYKRVGEAMDKYFVTGNSGVIIGGPGPTKENFVKMRPFNYQIKVLGVVDTGYTDEYGLREIMKKSEDIIAGQEAIKEKKLIDKFIKEVVQGGLAIYGEAPVREAIEIRKAHTVLLSEGLKWKRITAQCTTNGEKKTFNLREGEDVKSKFPECRGKVNIIEQKDLIDDLILIAEKNNIKVEMVSSDTAEGAQFLQAFYGIGAFLRYK